MIHACTLKNRAFVGIGATVLDGAVIEEGGMLAAGGLLTPGKVIGRNELWTGSPAKLRRVMDADEQAKFDRNAEVYRELARDSARGCVRSPRQGRIRHHFPCRTTGGCRMRARIVAFAGALALAACTVPPGQSQAPQPVADLPQGFFGSWIDPDLGAINETSYVFGSPDILRGNPVAALRAVACVEYLAVESHSPRWIAVSPLTVMQLDQARDELRRVLGIAPDAPPPLVIDTVLRILHDLQLGNTAGARALIRPPLFRLPPDQTLALLTNLPPLPITHAATQQAELQVMRIH